MKNQKTRPAKDIAIDILSGAATALAYTDEEIYSTLPLNEAKEFIELRNRVIADEVEKGYSMSEEIENMLAAEKKSRYNWDYP